LALDYAFTRGYFPDDAELPMLVREPFHDHNLGNSFRIPSTLRTPSLVELETTERTIEEPPDTLNEEELHKQKSLSPTQALAATTTPLSSPRVLNSPYMDVDNIPKSQDSPLQATPRSGKFPALHPAHEISRTNQDYNFRDDFLDFLNFESPTFDSQSTFVPLPGDQKSYNDDDLNTLDINTALGFGNTEVSNSEPGASSSGTEGTGNSLSDHVNLMGVHTALDFGDERPLWSDYMLNQILSPISTSSGVQ
jgi:hypothetical protein